MTDDLDFAAMLCSRLCHDLISPVGAVGNGVELLRAMPEGGREEIGLIEDSAKAAQAALAFFRIGFGMVGADARALSSRELGGVAAAYFGPSRHRLAWPVEGADLPRGLAKLMLLMLLSAATATPIGGALTVAPPRDDPPRLSVRASGRKAGLSAEHVAMAQGAAPATAPREAHLALMAQVAARAGLSVEIAQSEEAVEIVAS
ncbi:MAG: histidine phosphotransferase family protein [Rubrimonas sp.]|uniref:histidine phosphotransferase family protein n=1 Tax=Rubrimonas sp. TaxID=2036015 RepID=UPI002FDD662B